MPDQVLSKIHQLAGFQFPAVRKTLHHFLNISQDEQTDLAQVISIVELDPALLAVFLSTGKASIRDWHQGIDTSQYKHTALALSNQYASRASDDAADCFYNEQWQRSLMHASLCGGLAERTGADPTLYRILGLCAGLGHHFLARVYGQSYIAVATNITDRNKLIEAEENLFGISGADIASDLLKSWGYSVDTLCYQYCSLDELIEASQSVQILGFANKLLESLSTAPSDALLAAARQIFDLGGAQLAQIIESSENTISKSLVHLDSIPSDQFSADLAMANISAGIENSLADGQISISDLAKLIFGIKNSIHFQVDKDKLFARTDSDDVLSLSLNSERSEIARCYRNELPITAERDALSSIVEKQVLQQLGTSALCIIPLGQGGVLACGISMRKVVDEALLKCFQKSVTRQFNQSKPLVELDYVQARVSEVTHEVNNPLAIVQNYLHTLSLKIDENSQVQTDIQTISREMLRISDIVKKYGQIGQQEDLLREEININVLLEELSSVFRGGHESITFNLQLDTAMPLVLIIPDSLKQVIVNLLKNALEAIGNMPQGQISIASHGSINFGGDQYIEILITDNGPGIPLSIRDKLFLKNHSSKGSGHSGLGLSIVKQLLSEMGGLISCRSQVEGEGSAGTSFQILIPLINNE